MRNHYCPVKSWLTAAKANIDVAWRPILFGADLNLESAQDGNDQKIRKTIRLISLLPTLM